MGLQSIYRRCRFWQKKIFSDEAHFDGGGYVNKQYCCIWGTENPHAYIEKPTHPKRVTVWCGFWSRGIIKPFYFRKWAMRDHYSQWRSLSGHDERIFVHKNWREAYWQHLVSTRRRYVPHSRSYTRRLALCFWRSHYQPQSWCRLASSELWPLDYYLWDAVKDKCYAGKPEKTDSLKDNIRESIGEIQLHTIDVLKNWTNRYCTVSRGSHLNEIIFHY